MAGVNAWLDGVRPGLAAHAAVFEKHGIQLEADLKFLRWSDLDIIEADLTTFAPSVPLMNQRLIMHALRTIVNPPAESAP
eukprot:1436806-Prymnesium_polylepis.2